MNNQTLRKRQITYKILPFLQLSMPGNHVNKISKSIKPSREGTRSINCFPQTELGRKKSPPTNHLRRHQLTFSEILKGQVGATVLVWKTQKLHAHQKDTACEKTLSHKQAWRKGRRPKNPDHQCGEAASRRPSAAAGGETRNTAHFPSEQHKSTCPSWGAGNSSLAL